MIRKRKLLLLIVRILFQTKGIHLFWWDEWVVSAFPDLAEIIQYKMVRGSGASSSNPNPRWNIDLNLSPREEVLVPVEEAPEPDMDVYGGTALGRFFRPNCNHKSLKKRTP